MALQLFRGGKMSIADNLQRLRKQQGLNQEQLAERSGVSLTQISKIERNETDPRVSTVEKLARALNCSTDQLLFNEATEGLTGLLKRAFERASKLDALDKAALLKVINMACAGGTMIKTIDELHEDANKETDPTASYYRKMQHPDDLIGNEIAIQEIILGENEEYHRRIDGLAEQEAKEGRPWTILPEN